MRTDLKTNPNPNLFVIDFICPIRLKAALHGPYSNLNRVPMLNAEGCWNFAFLVYVVLSYNRAYAERNSSFMH